MTKLNVSAMEYAETETTLYNDLFQWGWIPLNWLIYLGTCNLLHKKHYISFAPKQNGRFFLLPPVVH